MSETDFGSVIYVNTKIERENLTSSLAHLFNSFPDKWNNVKTSSGEFSVLKNDEFDEKLQKDDVDGFLYYRYLIEIEPNVDLEQDDVIQFVSKILKFLWSQGFPAVASCAYEEALPNKGGYKSENVPKPL